MKRIDNLEANAWKDESVTRAITAFGELTRRGLLAKGTAELDHLGSQAQLMKSKAGLLPCGNWLENEMKPVIPTGFGLSMFGIPPLDTSSALPRGVHVAATAPFAVPVQAKNPEGGFDYLRAMLDKEVAGDQVITWYFADWYPELGKTAGVAGPRGDQVSPELTVWVRLGIPNYDCEVSLCAPSSGRSRCWSLCRYWP